MSKFSESNLLKFTTKDDFDNEPKYFNNNILFQKQFAYQDDNYKKYRKYDEPFIECKMSYLESKQCKEIEIINLELEKLIKGFSTSTTSYYNYEKLLYQVKNIQKIIFEFVNKYNCIDDIEYNYIKSLKKIIGQKNKLDDKTVRILKNLISLIEEYYDR